jgi:WD40 repeat protein
VDFVDRTPDGRFRAVSSSRNVRVWNPDGTTRAFPHDGSSGHPVSLSPDGRWLAVGTQHGTSVRIFDCQDPSQRAHKEIPCGISALGAFSPDGKWLICSGTTANVVFQTGTWQEVHRIPRVGGLFGFIHFTADGKSAMINRNHAQYDLVECGTWRHLLSITSVGETQLSRTALSPSGRFFAAVGFRREINIWDLVRLRRELSALGL